MKTAILSMATMLAAIITAKAEVADSIQETSREKPLLEFKAGEGLTITPIGRMMFDGALFVTPDKQFHDGVALSEARIGLVASYGKYKARVEMGYIYGSFTPRDIYIEANFNPKTFVRAGYVLPQWGLNASYNASAKSTMEQPVSNAVFETQRMLGVMGGYIDGPYFATVNLLFEPKGLVKSTDELGGGTAWGLNTRLVYRPITTSGRVVQVGWSGGYMSPEYSDNAAQNHRSYSFSANYPTRVARISALSATINDAKSMFKFTPELLLSYNRFALESQYYFMQVNRKYDLPAYRAYGAYAILRGLIIGDKYNYNSAMALIDPPARKGLELSLCYNYTCMSNADSGIYGGRLSEVSATLDWYINKYLTWRLRYGYTHVWDRAGYHPGNVAAFQTRIQFLF